MNNKIETLDEINDRIRKENGIKEVAQALVDTTIELAYVMNDNHDLNIAWAIAEDGRLKAEEEYSHIKDRMSNLR